MYNPCHDQNIPIYVCTALECTQFVRLEPVRMSAVVYIPCIGAALGQPLNKNFVARESFAFATQGCIFYTVFLNSTMPPLTFKRESFYFSAHLGVFSGAAEAEVDGRISLRTHAALIWKLCREMLARAKKESLEVITVIDVCVLGRKV